LPVCCVEGRVAGKVQSSGIAVNLMAPVLPSSDSFQLPRCYLATAAATCKGRGPDGRPVDELGTVIVPDCSVRAKNF